MAKAATPAAVSAPADGSVYAALLAAARQVEGGFADKHDKETVNVFLIRLAQAISDLPDPHFDAMPEAADAWYNAALPAIKGRQDVALPEGMVVEGAAKPAAKGKDAAPAPAAEPAKKPNALMEHNAKRKAEKEAREAAAKAAPAAETANAAEPAPAKRTGAQALAEHNAKRKAEKEAREAAAAKDAKPGAKLAGKVKPKGAAAAKPKAEKAHKPVRLPKTAKEKANKPDGVVKTIRRLIVQNQAITNEAILAACEAAGFPAANIKPSTLASVRTDTMATISLAIAAGLWGKGS